MFIAELKALLEKVKGCTFASLDTETQPSSGIRKLTVSESILLFNSKVSGYENMVRRRLEALGKNPDNFVLQDLPWGQRMEGWPGCIIQHRDGLHLQTIVMRHGTSEVFIGDKKVPPEEVQFLLPSKKPSNQGLPDEKAVIVRTYSLKSITAIRLMGEELASTAQERAKKPTLRMPGLRRD